MNVSGQRGAALIVAAMLLIGEACAEVDRTDNWRISVQVTDDEHIAVKNATIHVLNHTLKTNGHGIAETTIKGREGDTVATDIICPKNWIAAGKSNQKLILKKTKAISSNAEIGPGLQFLCLPQQKDHVLIVKTNGVAQLPIQLNGETVAATDNHGVAQVVVSGRSDEQVHLRVTTDAYPLLRPQNPSLIISLPAKRKIMVFEQTFEEARTPRKRMQNKRVTRHRGPRRL